METILKAQKVAKKFGKLKVIDNISLEIKRGESVVLFGPSGCGKTTFLKIISGIIKPTSGEIFKDYGKLGFVFQEDRLIPWLTVEENLLFVNEDKTLSDKILSMVGLEKFKKYYPSELSGGMKKRVNIARALVVNPDFLILDEPFSSLDYHIKIKLIKDFLELKKKFEISVLAVTHDPKEASFLGNRILFLTSRPSKIFYEITVDTPESTEKKILDMLEKSCMNFF